MLSLSPEIIQGALTIGAFLVGLWLRGRGIPVPIPGPKPPTPTPVTPGPAPTPTPAPPLDLLDLLRRLEPLLPLLLQLRRPGQIESLADELSRPEVRLFQAGEGSTVIRVEYEIPVLVPKSANPSSS